MRLWKPFPRSYKKTKDLFIGEHDHTIKTLGLNWQPKTDTFYFNRPQSQCSVVTMSLPEHEETVIECPSVELDEFQKSDFPQLVVNFDCNKLKEIHLMDSHASNHATLHICLINSMQFSTGTIFNAIKKKHLQKTPIGDFRDVVSDTDSCPKSSELSEPENNYSNTENQKTEKQKLVVTFEDKIFAKNEKFDSEKQYHSKTTMPDTF